MSVLNKRWLFPIKLGVIYGLITGFCNVNWIISYYDYFHFHLYNTAFKLLVPEINRCVLIGCAVSYAIWLIILAGSILKGKIKIAYCLVVAGAAIISASKNYYIIAKFSDIKYLLFQTSLFQTAYEQAKWQLIVSLIIIVCALCFITWRRIKAKHQKIIKENTSSVSIFLIIKSFILGFEHQSWLFVSIFTLFIGLNLALGLFWGRPTLAKRNKPNVVIIMIDTLRADHVGCYGYKRNTTPNIDRFAKDSTRFSDAISNSSWTTASVSSFMTSQLPQTTLAVAYGDKVMPALVSDPDMSISPRCVTMAQLFSDNEYKTAAITSNPQYSIKKNAWQGFQYFDESNMLSEITSPGVLSTAKEWIAQNQNNRFLLFTLFMDTHSPYRKFPGFDFDPTYKGKDADKIIIHLPYNINTSSVKHMTDLYDSGIAYSDHQVGLLLDDLKKRGLYDSSLIVILSDHGEEFRDHGSLFHGETLYNEVVNVPLIIKLPYQTKGRVVSGKFSLIDLLPTVLKATSKDSLPAYFQGNAVDINNTDNIKNGYIYGHTNLGQFDVRSVQNDDYKLIMDMKSKKEQLFNLKSDSFEKRNVITANPEKATALKKLMIDKDNEVRPDISLAEITQIKRDILMIDIRNQYKKIAINNKIAKSSAKMHIDKDASGIHPMKAQKKTTKSNAKALAEKMRSLGYMQ